MSITPPSKDYRWPSLKMDGWKIIALAEHLDQAGENYGLGSKIDLPSFVDPDKRVDCSGFVRWAIYHATDPHMTIPDGSVQQREWVESHGFKESTDGGAKDGAIRIAFLSPKDGGGVGHVALIVDGETCESHGGAGPDRRAWGSCGWMAKAKLFVLTPPNGGAK